MSVGGSTNRRIAEVAGRQRGRAARRQLLAAGVGAGAITRRLATGDLIARGNGVYATAPIIGGPWVAETEALLAVRDGAVLSHLTALSLWELGRGPAASLVEVTIAGAPTARRVGTRVHRVAALGPHDVRFREGLPVTAPSAALIQSASLLGPEALESAFDAAAERGLTNLSELETALSRAGQRAGTPLVRDLITEYLAFSYNRSKAERLLQRQVGAAGLMRPLTNVKVRSFEVDALWLPHRVIVEVDGFAYHGDRAAFERDRLRDQILTAAGYTVMRVTWRQLTRQPIAVMVRLGQVLNAAEAAG